MGLSRPVGFCPGCGAPLDVTREPACPQCRRPVLAPVLSDLVPLLDAARARLGLRTDEGARQALRTRLPGEHERIHTLTGRAEHREALRLLEARFWRRWGWVVAVFASLWLLGWCSIPRLDGSAAPYFAESIELARAIDYPFGAAHACACWAAMIASEEKRGSAAHMVDADESDLPGTMPRPIKITLLGAGSTFTPRLANDLLALGFERPAVVHDEVIQEKLRDVSDRDGLTRDAA